MKIPLLIHDESGNIPILDVSGEDRFEPLLLLYSGRTTSNWNFLTPTKYRLGYFCLSEWAQGGFQPVVDHERIPALVAQCGYEARYTLEKIFIAIEDEAKVRLNFYIDSSQQEIEEPTQLTYQHLKKALRTEEFGASILSEEPLRLAYDFESLNYASGSTNGAAVIHEEVSFKIFFYKDRCIEH